LAAVVYFFCEFLGRKKQSIENAGNDSLAGYFVLVDMIG
jgi:hypothetical protein